MFALSLLLQAGAVLAVWIYARSYGVRRSGVIFVTMAVIFHGLTEVVQLLFPGRNDYRLLVSADSLGRWLFIVSLSILAFAVVYILSSRFLLNDKYVGKTTYGARPAYVERFQLPWLTVLLGVVLLVRIAPSASQAEGPIWQAATQLTLLLIPVIGVSLAVRYGANSVAPIIICAVVLLSLIGQRSLIIFTVALFIYGLALVGIPWRRRQLIAVTVVAVIAVLAVSGARETVGRKQFVAGQGVEERIGGFSTGLLSLGTDEGREAILNDWVYRFDGNSFGALMLEGLEAGTEPVGATTTASNFLLLVPSTFLPGKLNADVSTLSEEVYLINTFGLPDLDYLPTYFGTFVAYGGPAILIFLAAALGVAFAVADSWVLRRATLVRFTVGLAMVSSVLYYERGPLTMLVSLRTALVLVVLALLATIFVPRFVSARDSASLPGPKQN